MNARTLETVDEVCSDTVTILDTTEVRWFAEGVIPPDVVSWFTCDGTTGAVEERCDTYLMDGRRDRGVKRRFRETLELKVRCSLQEPITLADGLGGPLEGWRRWSPARGLAPTNFHDSWIDVHKIIVKRRFSLVGDEIVWTFGTPPPATTGCDVEIVALEVADLKAWSFAFAAFGPASERRTALCAAWRTIAADPRCPERLGSVLARPMGYPEWLSRFVSPDLAAPVETRTRQLVS